MSWGLWTKLVAFYVEWYSYLNNSSATYGSLYLGIWKDKQGNVLFKEKQMTIIIATDKIQAFEKYQFQKPAIIGNSISSQ